MLPTPVFFGAQAIEPICLRPFAALFRLPACLAKLQDTRNSLLPNRLIIWPPMIYFAFTLVAIASRFLPHPPNVACLGAIGMFAGCYCSGRIAWFIPAAILLCSDTIGQLAGIPSLGFYSPVTMICVYAAATLAVPVGRMISRSEGMGLKFAGSVAGGSLVASTLFFLVSNLGVWASAWYPSTGEGLVNCYIAAIPFYGYTIAGDLFFSAIAFGGYAAVSAGQPSRELARQAV